MGSKSKSITVGYRYFMGLHLGLSLVADAITAITVGDRNAWTGEVTANGPIDLDALDLFGGDQREGGIAGRVSVMFGRADQGNNAYLDSQFGSPNPPYRGFTGLVFHGPSDTSVPAAAGLSRYHSGYLASLNPYVKPWAVQLRSITEGWYGGECWYKATARILVGGTGGEATALLEQFTGGDLSAYSTLEGDGSGFAVIVDGGSNAIRTGQAAGSGNMHSVIGRPLATPAALYRLRTRFKVTQVKNDDCGGISLRDADGEVVVNFIAMRDATVDPLRRPSFTFRDQPGAPGNLMGTGAVTVGARYLLDALYDVDAGTFACTITDEASGAEFASLAVPVSTRAPVSQLCWVVDDFGGHSGSNGAGTTVWDDAEVLVGEVGDAMNPAHIIYQALTDPDWGMGYPAATIDDASFRAAADQLFAEGFGLCLKWSNQTTIQDFTQIVADHAGLVYGQDRRTGKFRMLLLRTPDEATLPVFTAADVRVLKFQRPSLADTVNEILVTYVDAETGKDATTPPLQNLANIQGQGRVVSQTLSFPGLPTHALATRVGLRELAARSTPLWRFTLEFKRQARDLLPGSPFILDLTDVPDIGVRLVMRAGEMDYGTPSDRTIRGECIEDVFSLPSATYVGDPGAGSSPPSGSPVAATAAVFEVPYRDLVGTLSASDLAALPAAAGYLGAVAVLPAASQTNFGLYTRLGSAGYSQAATGDFAPSAVLAAGLACEAGPSTVAVTDASLLAELAIGSAAFLGEGASAELVRIDDVDVAGATVTLGRGCGDTVPAAWPSGTRLWGYGVEAAADPHQYASGETVTAKVAPRAAGGELALGLASELPLGLAGRAARPYPPGQFQLAGSAYPASIDRSADASAWTVTWAHRDRVLQADDLVDHSEPGVGPESGVRYGLRFLRADTLAELVARTDLAGPTASVLLAYSGNVVAELWALTDSAESWQRHRWTFAHTANAATTASSIDGVEALPGGVTIVDGNDPPTTDSPAPAGETVADGGRPTTGTPRALTIGATVIDPCAAPYNAAPSASAATNSAAFNAAFAALPVGGGTVQPSVLGDYTFDTANPVKPVSHSRLKFPAGCRMKAAGTSFVTSPSAGRHLVVLDGVTHVEVQAARATGYRAYWAANGGRAAFGASEWAHWLFLTNGTTEVNVLPSTAVDFVGDAISIGRSCSNIWIGGLVTRNNRRQGVSNGGDNVKLSDCDIGYIGGSDGTAPMAGVDNEVDDPASYATTGMVMERCRVHHCSGPGVNLYKSANNITLTDLVSEYNQRGVVGLDSDNVTIDGAATALRYNRYEGLYVSGSCSTWSVRAAFYYNKTTQYPNQAGTGTTSAPSSTLKARNAYVASTVSGLSYASGTTWGPV